jgi:hypothetical protein
MHIHQERACGSHLHQPSNRLRALTGTTDAARGASAGERHALVVTTMHETEQSGARDKPTGGSNRCLRLSGERTDKRAAWNGRCGHGT